MDQSQRIMIALFAALAVVFVSGVGLTYVDYKTFNDNIGPQEVGDPIEVWSIGESNWFGLVVGSMASMGVLLIIFAVGGVKTVTPENVLDKKIRQLLLEHIRNNPGTHLREIAEKLSMNVTNARWHLRKLEKTDLVTGKKSNGKLIYYAKQGGVAARDSAISGSILKNDNALNIMLYVHSHSGCNQREIADALEVNHGTVRWHVGKLMDAKLVSDMSSGNRHRYFSTEAGRISLERLTGEGLATVVHAESTEEVKGSSQK
ncbi:MAG: hypothetical protein CVT48_05840 [Thermoplasmata archaeon HGW-Thermoplasmata-1]|nr:MAG: hypothetical protein CVT48_05840 [Thermoplasmata archaeon HGW-Thermoplasmata-1]